MRYGKSWGQLGMKYKLSEVMDVIGGGTPKTSKPEYWNGDIPWLSVKDFNNDYRYVYRTEKSITKEGLENSTTKLLDKGDMIISARGTVGEVASVPYPMAFNQSCYGLRAKSDLIVSDFLYYLIKYNVNVLKKQTHGSVFDTITRNTFDDIEVDIPDFDCQKKIASLLSDLDAKIELNIKINENLELQAQALYSAWFESYVPFGGKMPADWNTGFLADVAKISTKSFNPAKNPGIKLEHYSIPAFDEKKFPVFETSDDIKSNKYILSSISVLASKLNPDTKRIWRPMCLTDNAVCSTEFIVFESANTEWKDFVYSIINSNNFSNWMCAHTTGSTNSRQRTTPAKTLEFEIVIPPENVIMDFCSTITPMYDLIAENRKENHRLEKLRDTLLPKLMSGELDVSNIEV